MQPKKKKWCIFLIGTWHRYEEIKNKKKTEKYGPNGGE